MVNNVGGWKIMIFIRVIMCIGVGFVLLFHTARPHAATDNGVGMTRITWDHVLFSWNGTRWVKASGDKCFPKNDSPPTFDSMGYKFASCTHITLEMLRFPVFMYLPPGAWYNHHGPCQVELREEFINSPMTAYTRAQMIGMVTMGDRYMRLPSDCATDLLNMGKTWGYSGGTKSGFTTNLRYGNYSSDKNLNPLVVWCLYIDNKRVTERCLSGSQSTNPIEPKPIACDIQTDPIIQFGVKNVTELAGTLVIHPIDIICSDAGTVYLSLTGGNGMSDKNGIGYDLGPNIYGTACVGDVECNGNPLLDTVTFTSQGTLRRYVITRLTPKGTVYPGEFTGNFVLIAQYP